MIEIHQLYSDKTSLSHARNIAIEYIYENEIIADYVMFPDDDSTFDLLFFERFMKEVDGNTAYIIDVYESGYETLFIKNKLSQNSIISKKQYQLVCSVNMLIPFLAFTKIKFFDEDLGVGAKYGSSEDVDYFIRTLAFTNQFIYNKNLYNYHPRANDKFKMMSINDISSRFRKYGEGAIFTLLKHNMYFEALNLSFRAIGGSIVYLLKLDFKLFYCYNMAFYYRIKTFLLVIFKK